MNSWAELAAKQLFQTWTRCGVTHLPAASQEGADRAGQWLEQQNVAVGVEKAQSLGIVPSQHPIEPTATVRTGTGEIHGTAKLSPDSAPLDPVPRSASIGAALPPSSISTKIGLAQKIATGSPEWESVALDFNARNARFELLKQEVQSCRKCTEIACRRTQTVFGTGPANARIVLFGEAPGAEEDRTGEPFVGAAGQLMDKILAATGLRREDVFIMNSLKCRPPNNRTPVDAEIENCRPFFESQLETIQPDYIVCWGSVAVRAVLRSTESVGRLRGRFHQYRGAKVLVTYHPAYLLRNPDAKKLTWEDMKLLMRELGIPIPPPKRAN